MERRRWLWPNATEKEGSGLMLGWVVQPEMAFKPEESTEQHALGWSVWI